MVTARERHGDGATEPAALLLQTCVIIAENVWIADATRAQAARLSESRRRSAGFDVNPVASRLTRGRKDYFRTGVWPLGARVFGPCREAFLEN
jgi:hypothetical protein